jgi:hypothetical protein
MAAQLVIRLTADERRQLDQRAAADDRATASYVRRLLRLHLAETEATQS